MARRIFIIIAFILALDVAIPTVNAMSPFSAAYQSTPANDPGFGVTKVVHTVGCGTPDATGNYSCNVTIGGTAGSSSILGPIVNTILVFGNFFYAAGFLGQLAGGVVVPSYYLTQWMGGLNISPGNALWVFLIQGLIWFAYADGIVYIISGRDIFG